VADSRAKLIAILGTAFVVGIASGMFGVGGGILLVPMLVLLHHFEQHQAQGTSLVALVPPSGLFAFLAYYAAHQVNFRIGLLIIPGVFLGGIVGGHLAVRLSATWMRRVFAGILFALGAFEFIWPYVHSAAHAAL
jgi:uncharacterized protein